MTVSEPPVYFLDISALVKRYHPERGSEVVQRAFADPTARRLISDISIIEVHSAFPGASGWARSPQRIFTR